MSFPSSGIQKQCTYILLFPIIFPLWLTLPDTRKRSGENNISYNFINILFFLSLSLFLSIAPSLHLPYSSPPYQPFPGSMSMFVISLGAMWFKWNHCQQWGMNYFFGKFLGGGLNVGRGRRPSVQSRGWHGWKPTPRPQVWPLTQFCPVDFSQSTSVPSAPHLTVSLYLYSSGINAWGESRALEGQRVSSKSPSRVRNRDEGVAGRNGREKRFPDEGSLICPPGKIVIFHTKELS